MMDAKSNDQSYELAGSLSLLLEVLQAKFPDRHFCWIPAGALPGRTAMTNGASSNSDVLPAVRTIQ
jgi:hypothetical protein